MAILFGGLAASAHADTWHALGTTTAPFANGWRSTTATGVQTGRYRVDALGMVILSGYLAGGPASSETIAFTLPIGYRPKLDIIYPSLSGGAARIYVASSGEVYLTTTTATAVTLEGVRFEPADYIEPQLGAAGGTGPAGPKGDPGADGQPRKVLDEGAELPVRAAVNFVGAGVEATDDAANDRTKVTITGTAASGVDSAAIVSAVNASRDWLHADLWWLIGLVCALFFGYHLYRAVSPRA